MVLWELLYIVVIKTVTVKPNLQQPPINVSSFSGSWFSYEGNLERTCCHWFCCFRTCLFSSRIEDAILQLELCLLVSKESAPFFSDRLKIGPKPGALTEVEFNYLDESLGANAVWRVTFWSSLKNPMFIKCGGKEAGILGIPGMPPPSNRLTLRFSSTERISKDKSGKQNTKAGSCMVV